MSSSYGQGMADYDAGSIPWTRYIREYGEAEGVYPDEKVQVYRLIE